MKKVISIFISLCLVGVLCHGQTVSSREKNEEVVPQTALMNDSVILPQIMIKNRSLIDVVDSISRIKWEETGKTAQNYVMQLFMVGDTLVIYTGWIQLEWLIDAICSRDDLVTTVYFIKQKGKVIGFVGYNNCRFFIVDTGIPEELRDSILGVSEISRLTLRPYEPIKEWNGIKVYDVNVHRGTTLYMMLNDRFVKCKISTDTIQPNHQP